MGVRPRRWWYRLNRRLAATSVASWVYARTLHHIDRVLLRATGGRVSVPGVFAGLPVIRLTTTGAKTGKRRTVPVLGFRDGDRWIVVASNWGQDDHPAWYYNLSANPEVEVTHRDRTATYEARDATGEEREEYWQQASEAYVGFEAYRNRTDDRELPIVVLAPTAD